jgi:hypothetical protein
MVWHYLTHSLTFDLHLWSLPGETTACLERIGRAFGFSNEEGLLIGPSCTTSY